jgi:hypothetical protein
LFWEDVDARLSRDSLNVILSHLSDVRLYTSTIENDNEPFQPPPNATISPIDDDARSYRDWLNVAMLQLQFVELKISTIFDIWPPLVIPPAKKANSRSDVDWRGSLRGWESVDVFHFPLK